MEVAVFSDDKQTREENIREVTAKLQEAFADKEEWLAILGEAVYQYQKKTVRKMILKDQKRPDGREINQIRALAAEVDIIPRVHGSAMFTRGQTQICTMTTLAPLAEAQKVDGLDEFEMVKRLAEVTGACCPEQLANLRDKAVRFDGCCSKDSMDGVVFNMLGI